MARPTDDNQTPFPSVADSVGATRDQARQDDASPGHHALGAESWSHVNAADGELRSLADHSETLDEPGKLGTLAREDARTATVIERSLGYGSRVIAGVEGTARRLDTLRERVGENWHRRIAVEHSAVLHLALTLATAAEVAFIGAAAPAAGIYGSWRWLFGAGIAASYVGVGALLAKAVHTDNDLHHAPEATVDGQPDHHDPIITGRRPRSSAASRLVAILLLLLVLGVTGLTFLRETHAAEVAAAQRADRAANRAALDRGASQAGASTAQPGSASAGTQEDDSRSAWTVGLAMFGVAVMIGGGIAVLMSLIGDPVVREWDRTTKAMDHSVEELDEVVVGLAPLDEARAVAHTAHLDHHHALAHRTHAERFQAHAQELVYLQQFEVADGGQLPSIDKAAWAGGTIAHGHGNEIQVAIERSARIDARILDFEHHAALAAALAAGYVGIQPTDTAPEQAMHRQLQAWLLAGPAPASVPAQGPAQAQAPAPAQGPAPGPAPAAPIRSAVPVPTPGGDPTFDLRDQNGRGPGPADDHSDDPWVDPAPVA